MKQQMESDSIFKGTSKTIQNEILDVILEEYHNTVKSQILNCDFVVIQADETTDVSTVM